MPAPRQISHDSSRQAGRRGGQVRGNLPINADRQTYAQLCRLDGTETAPADVIHVDALHPQQPGLALAPRRMDIPL